MVLRLHDPRVKSSRPRVQDASQEKHARHLPRRRLAYPVLFPQTRPVRTPDRQLLSSIPPCPLSPVSAFSLSSCQTLQILIGLPFEICPLRSQRFDQTQHRKRLCESNDQSFYHLVSSAF